MILYAIRNASGYATIGNTPQYRRFTSRVLAEEFLAHAEWTGFEIVPIVCCTAPDLLQALVGVIAMLETFPGIDDHISHGGFTLGMAKDIAVMAQSGRPL